MSDPEEEVPELDADAKAFLARHQQTGEASPEALARVGARLSAPAPAPEAKPATITRLPARRPMFPPEVKAAAAVVIFLLGAQALYLLLRERAQSPSEVKPPEVSQKADAQLTAVAEAWRAGDFERARRLASKECSSAACGAISGELAEMLELTTRVDELSDDERGKLGAFDKKLSDGRDSALRRRLENTPPRDATPEELASAEALFKEASDQKRAKNYEAAVVALEKCIRTTPAHHPCYRLLGSVYASIATRDQSAHDMELARSAYERFLEVAPEDDEYVPKVRAILDAGGSPTPEPFLPAFRVGAGQQGTWTHKRTISRVALGDPEIADVKTTSSRELVIEGHKAGKTTVLIWDSENFRTSFVIDVTAEPQPNRVSASAQTPSAPATDAVPAVSVALVSGGYSIVTLGELTRAAVGNPVIADIKVVGGDRIRIEGGRPGRTMVQAWLANGERRVIDVEVKESNNFEDKVQKLLVEASMARARNEFATTRKALRAALKLDPENSAALQMKSALRNDSRDVYLRAYQLKESSPNEALRLFREVMEMTDPEDETHQKAKSRVAELSGR